MKHKNFDTYFREIKKQPISFEYNGKKYELGYSLPMIAGLKIAEMQATKGKEYTLTDEEGFELVQLTLGKHVYDSLLDDGIGAEELMEIFKWALDEFTNNSHVDEPNPKGQNRKRTA